MLLLRCLLSAQDKLRDQMMKFSWCTGYIQAMRENLMMTDVRLGLLRMAGLKFAGPEKVQTSAVIVIPEQARHPARQRTITMSPAVRRLRWPCASGRCRSRVRPQRDRVLPRRLRFHRRR